VREGTGSQDVTAHRKTKTGKKTVRRDKGSFKKATDTGQTKRGKGFLKAKWKVKSVGEHFD